MDFDADGNLDLISGSYDPGEIYLFRGRGRGDFAARETIVDRDGGPILKSPDQREAYESFGSWVTTVDWDADGDLDLLIGTFEGLIFLRRNEGTRTRPAYATENKWLRVEDKILRVPGGEHANPVIADWDGDGTWDIITGAGNGGVYWYRNRGTPNSPAFESPIALVPQHDGIGYSEVLEPGHEPKPGIRSQIAVTDHDGDGKLDLLLGDFCTYLHIRNDLTPEERRRFSQVRATQAQSSEYLRTAMENVRKAFARAMEGLPASEWTTPENEAKWQKMYEDMKESPEYKRQQAIYEEADKAMKAFVDSEVKGHRLGDDPAVSHGYVWLFRRK